MPKFDGVNEPRPIQSEMLTWFKQNWSRADVLGLLLHTGSGKSAVARALQIEHGGAIVTISNALLGQYSSTYPDVNVLKGADTWACKETKLSCGESNEILGRYCGTCPYKRGRESFVAGKPTFTNPAAYYYTSMAKDWKAPEVVIIDEAHQLLEFLTGMNDEFWPIGWEGLSETTDIFKLVDWASRRERFHAKQAQNGGPKKSAALALRFKRIGFMLQECQDDIAVSLTSQRFNRKMTRGVRVIQVRPSQAVIRKFMGTKKTILMSATLLPSDVKEFSLNKRSLFKEFDNPIPVENRPVIIDHIPGHKGAATNPEAIVAWILRQREKYPGNCIVHVTYALGDKLRPYLKDAIFNTPETKIEAISTFKRDGGLFVAAGCAEGVDLPYDTCGLNLIPILYRDNFGADVVQKRLAEPNGRRNYDLKTIRITIQQVGRSNRAADDSSVAVVGDMGLRLLLSRYRQEISPDFARSVK